MVAACVETFNISANAQYVAGINPNDIVEYIGYSKDNCYYSFYPHDDVSKKYLPLGEKIIVLNFDDVNGYEKVVVKNDICWIKKSDISTSKNWTTYNVYDNGNKAYMDWECISDYNSNQYALQEQAYTDLETGIRMVGDRYCIAIGQYYTNIVGTKIDLIVQHPDKSKSKIKCILGDCKANVDTDITNMYALDGSVSEFIVNTSSLPQQAKIMGDLSYINKDFNGIIIKVIVYKEN